MAGCSLGFLLLCPCSSSLSITALGMVDQCAKRSNMVYQYLVPLRFTSSAVEYDLYKGSLFGGEGTGYMTPHFTCWVSMGPS